MDEGGIELTLKTSIEKNSRSRSYTPPRRRIVPLLEKDDGGIELTVKTSIEINSRCRSSTPGHRAAPHRSRDLDEAGPLLKHASVRIGSNRVDAAISVQVRFAPVTCRGSGHLGSAAKGHIRT